MPSRPRVTHVYDPVEGEVLARPQTFTVHLVACMVPGCTFVGACVHHPSLMELVRDHAEAVHPERYHGTHQS